MSKPRHSWEVTFSDGHTKTTRACRKCGLIRITHREDPNRRIPWIEWIGGDGERIESELTPPCREIEEAVQ